MFTKKHYKQVAEKFAALAEAVAVVRGAADRVSGNYGCGYCYKVPEGVFLEMVRCHNNIHFIEKEKTK